MTTRLDPSIQQIEVIGTTVVMFNVTWTKVILPNGSSVSGIPTDDQWPMAREIGYDNIVDMCLDHDPTHVRLCHMVGVSCSYALRKAAGETLTQAEHVLAGLEEDAVLAVLKFKRRAEMHLADTGRG